MTGIVNDLLEVSRNIGGRIQLQLERAVPQAIVESAFLSARPLIDKLKHVTAVVSTVEPLWLYADAGRIEQVLVNLLNNAANYTPEGGRIEVVIDHEAPAAVVCARDNGIGISPEPLPRIFDLFTQAERSIDRAQDGLGMGLALVEQLITMHGGEVGATSVLGKEWVRGCEESSPRART